MSAPENIKLLLYSLLRTTRSSSKRTLIINSNVCLGGWFWELKHAHAGRCYAVLFYLTLHLLCFFRNPISFSVSKLHLRASFVPLKLFPVFHLHQHRQLWFWMEFKESLLPQTEAVRLHKWAPDCAALRSPCGGAVLLCPQPSGTEPLSAHTSSYSAPEDTHKSE